MPPSAAIIPPALPLSNVPPSPRSDVSGRTERSRESDKSIDRAMTQLSLSSPITAKVSYLLL
jgi:hypothetical protein